MLAAPIYARLTHKYTTGWAHLDRQEFVGLFFVTEPRVTSMDDDGDYRSIVHGKLRLDTLANARKLWRKHAPKDWVPRHAKRGTKPSRVPFKLWLRGQIGEGFADGCRCEHDCCGHYQRYARVFLEGRHVRVLVTSYQNL